MSDSLVIIPTYNEKENIEKIIRAVFSLEIPFDVLVVDDGSPDGTTSLVRSMQNAFRGRVHLEVREKKAGLGTAYIHGFKWALQRNYLFIFEMDADFSHNPRDLLLLHQACANGQADLAIGSRYISGVNVVNWPLSRVLLSYMASLYVRIITSMPVMDPTAGFKCYRRIVLESIDLNTIRFSGYAFQIEMKYNAWRRGFRIAEVPIIFTDRLEGQSKMSLGIFREAFFGVLQMKMKNMFS